MRRSVYDAVERLVARCGTRDPFAAADFLNVEVMYSSGIRQLKGMYIYILRNPFIVINANEDEAVQRIVCAHELGHDRLHRELAANGVMQETALFDMTARPEYEANLFAAELLLADEDIISVLSDGCDAFSAAGVLGTDVNLVALKIAAMKQRGYSLRADESLYDSRFLSWQ